MQQLPLPLTFRTDKSFLNFKTGANAELIHYLQALPIGAEPWLIYFWGSTGSGCSHLLQACCSLADQQGMRAAFVALADPHAAPLICEGLEQFDLVCLDDIDKVAGDAEWEEALFHLYNRIQINKKKLLIAAHQAPMASAWRLPDLRSRLQAGLVLTLHDLSDIHKCEFLIAKARESGLLLSEEVAEFILKRCRRDMPTLLAVLALLDKTSLAQQRKLTVPFVRSVLYSM